MITIRYDTYGFRDLGLDDAAEFVAEALGVTLSVRESSYRGVYYHAGGFGPPNLILSDNVRYRVWPNREGAVFKSILDVNGFGDMDDVQRRLTAGRRDPVLLKTAVYPDEAATDDNGCADEA